MSSRKPEKAKNKSGRKKLTLSKETLRDLVVTDRGAQAAKGVVGGRPNAPPTISCQEGAQMC